MQKEDTDDQTERLSRKHIQTLAFLQGVVKENNALKAKIAEYDEQKLHCDELHTALDEAQAKLKNQQEHGAKRTDDVVAVLVQQHQQELSRLAEEKATLERYWERMSKDMRLEIERLEKENAKLSDVIASLEKSARADRLAAADKAKQVAGDADGLRTQVDQLLATSRRQAEELTRAVAERAQLERSSSLALAEAAQRTKELELRNAELQRTSSHSAACHEEALKEAEAAKAQLRKAAKERSALGDRVAALSAELSAATAAAQQLRADLSSSEEGRRLLQAELDRTRDALQQQLQLQKTAATQVKDGRGQPSSFREFVDMKRELAAARDENAQLRERLALKPRLLPGIKQQATSAASSRPSSGTDSFKPAV